MSDGPLQVQIVGATGYGGLGMLELLLGHPGFEASSLLARDDAGRRIDDIYPHLAGRCGLVVERPGPEAVGAGADVVVFATPDGVSQGHAQALARSGTRFLDYSGDFRFRSRDDYASYARAHPGVADGTHRAEDLLGRSVYGVPELSGGALPGAPIVGNPGCFAIGIILGLAPLFEGDLLADREVTVDGLTGSSGAGKKPSAAQHFSHLSGNVVPYRVFAHQHVVEAELTLGRLGAGGGAALHFVPHLLGTTRGILSTMHARLKRPSSRDDLLARYRERYRGEPFVRVLDVPPTLKGTAGSNYCDISLATSADGRRVVVIASLDNLVKGQSGNALQNLNHMFGLDPAAGLARLPLYP